MDVFFEFVFIGVIMVVKEIEVKYIFESNLFLIVFLG